MIRTSLPTARQRRGMILIVVLSLLTLFAIVGISFVLIADQAALTARIASEGEGYNRPDSDAEATFSLFLGQLLYDAEDSGPGLYSGLRGHSLGRTLYGFNSGTVELNDKVGSGLGRPRIPLVQAGVPALTAATATGPAQYLGYLVNHTYRPGDGFLIDPERVAVRANAAAPNASGYVGCNVPYTYPDHNNFYLAALDPITGKVVCPSFHRPWLFGSLDPTAGNTNWTSFWGKYLTPRPRPAEHAGFPLPRDAGGDVKNLLGAPGGNDSIWIDIGAPVMTSADGRKYKMLFAPLILDMDGRINLNVHGNIRASGGAHASAQGWGPWEVNPARVLNADATEWQQVFNGLFSGPKQRIVGRYGPDRVPGLSGPTNVVGGGNIPRAWAPVDFDGIDNGPAPFTNPTGARTNRFFLPGEAGANEFQQFPTFPPGYASGSAGEQTDHPLLYNPLRQYQDDRRFSPRSLAGLLCQGGTSSQNMTSELPLLLPKNLNTYVRHLVTTHSADMDRPGAVPYIWDRRDPATAYNWDATRGYPAGKLPSPATQGTPIADPFLDIPGKRPATPADSSPPTAADRVQFRSEFDAATWRSQVGALLRVNLNRSLQPYPLPGVGAQLIDTTNAAVLQQVNNALVDRKLLADDIFDRLWRLTGAKDPTTVTPGTDDFRTLRWLAQLAVNIVDFIDEDEHITPYQWYPVPGALSNVPDWVYGTEMPGLVINEAYAQLDNSPGLLNGNNATGYTVGVWAELHNPRPGAETISADPNVQAARDNVARLVAQDAAANNQPIYRIVLAGYANSNDALNALRDPDNTVGNASTATIMPLRSKTLTWDGNLPAGTPTEVLPANNKYSSGNSKNDGFYVVGANDDYIANPPVGIANINPNLPTSWAGGTANMRLDVGLLEVGTFAPTLLLQRLACPHMPPHGLNPYVTVDVFHLGTLGQANDARAYLDNGAVNAAAFVGVANRVARGRAEPFAGGDVQSQSPNTPAANQPLHTFFRHNAKEDPDPAAVPAGSTPLGGTVNYAAAGQTLRRFDWLAHLDRPVVSPIELLNVSAWKPHQLTEKFVQAVGGKPHQHVAGWYDPDTRLYRFLEFSQAAPRGAGVTQGGRFPGKININTIMHPSVLRALCDGSPDGTVGNRFTDAQIYQQGDATALFYKVMSQRSPGFNFDTGVYNLNAPDPALSATPDRPFWSLAVGPSPGGDQWTGGPRGLENTLLAPVAGGNATSARLFDPFGGTAHPYQNMEILNKIYNSVTTRSNVFAVWVTVGYFEVTNENVRPVQLGAEIGQAEGRQIRHRFFALVDRTKMEAMRVQGQFNAAVTPAPGATYYADFGTGFSYTVPTTGKTWSLKPGAIVTFNPDTDFAETTAVEAVPNTNPVQYRGVVRRPYTTAPLPIIQYGNPGPWARYDPKKDPCVLYFGLVD